MRENGQLNNTVLDISTFKQLFEDALEYATGSSPITVFNGDSGSTVNISVTYGMNITSDFGTVSSVNIQTIITWLQGLIDTNNLTTFDIELIIIES